jgi:hypothetical protein
MAVTNGAELGPENILEVDGLCHRPPPMLISETPIPCRNIFRP